MVEMARNETRCLWPFASAVWPGACHKSQLEVEKRVTGLAVLATTSNSACVSDNSVCVCVICSDEWWMRLSLFSTTGSALVLSRAGRQRRATRRVIPLREGAWPLLCGRLSPAFVVQLGIIWRVQGGRGGESVL